MKKINDGLTPQQRFDKKYTRSVRMKLHTVIDKDIIDYLEKSGNMTGTIKTLVRKAIAEQE